MKSLLAGSSSTASEECVHEGNDIEKRRFEMLDRATQAIRNYNPQMFAEAAVVKLTAIGQRHIVVIDNALEAGTIQNLYGCLLHDGFRRTEFARPDTRQYKHSVTEYRPETLMTTPLSRTVRTLTKICFARPVGEPLEPYRMYTNGVLFGDVAFVHRDSSDHTNVTVLVYPNPEWRPEFGGETMFYDEGGEIIETVEPREGRIVLFHGSILHKGSAPGRLFHDTRYTTAFKFSPEDLPQAPPRQGLRRPTGGNDPEPQS